MLLLPNKTSIGLQLSREKVGLRLTQQYRELLPIICLTNQHWEKMTKF